MTLLEKVSLWGPVFLYVCFIFWLSSAPRVIPGMARFPWMDKPLHAVEYLPLGFLTIRAAGLTWPRWPLGRIALLGFFFACFIGMADEFYQRFTPMRFSSSLDTAADLVGASLGQLAGWALLFRKNRE